MKIVPNNLTIQQLFLVTNEQFSIPAYQRRYAWGTKQHRELFDDIRLLSDSDSHLFGTVLFIAGIHTPGVNVMELVDGQQRLTTLSILLHVMRKRFHELGDIGNDQQIGMLLQCKGYGSDSQPKIVLGDLDNPDYVRLTSACDTDLVTNRHLAEAFTNFDEWVGELDPFHYPHLPAPESCPGP